MMGKMWHSFCYVSFLIVFVFLGLMAILYIFQSRLIYYPLYQWVTTPMAIDLNYDTVFFKTKDGVKLSGWFIPAQEPRGIVLFCHGNAGNISHRLDSIQVFNRLGLSVFILDYRGYGKSEGKPTEKGTYLDAEAAIQYLVQERQVSPTEIIIFGRSLGGAIAAHLAKDYPPRALILESTFTSIPDMAKVIYPFLPVSLLVRFHYTTREYVQKITCPLLIIHSPEDDMIPFQQGRYLFEAAREPKEFLEISGSHNEGFIKSGEDYEGGLRAFIGRVGLNRIN